ncbi:SCP-like protein [Ancylostoma ceylanicum]|uniref:SCP-like protein n=1 Tax=Ancylostoma ceylanicum TaxID=53326 RepID=A0A0D6LGG6_9BILA|nr:SCP-like protein [Ancylostoma ceylanicum]
MHLCTLNWDCNIENNAFLRNCNKSVEIPQDFSEISETPQKTQALYKSGNTCVNDPCAQGSSCENYLCKLAQYTPATNTYPIPLCSPQKNDGMTYEMQMSVLNLANYYRRLLGSGWAQDKNGYAPIARRLYALTYNCDLLGHFAKQIADKCGDPPYTPYARNWVLTHHKINDVNIDQKAALEEAFKAWGEQSKKVDLQEIAGGVFYDGDVVTEASDWAKLTTERNAVIGCAVTKCQQKGFTLVICHYNTIFTVRDSLYTVGKPCAGCAKVNRKCDNALGGGLCIP